MTLKPTRSTRIKEALDFFTGSGHIYTPVYICMFWAEPILMAPEEPNPADTKKERSFEGVLLAPIMKP